MAIVVSFSIVISSAAIAFIWFTVKAVFIKQKILSTDKLCQAKFVKAGKVFDYKGLLQLEKQIWYEHLYVYMFECLCLERSLNFSLKRLIAKRKVQSIFL
ncbi:MAG: hypothetical protein ACFCAD_07075, partial [Pleurocapsa sp.]